MIRVHLTTNPRAGTIEVGTARHELASWHSGAKRTTYGTTTDGQQVTLAMGDPNAEGYQGGSLCIGNTNRAPRWTLQNCRSDERGTLEGMAFAVPSGCRDGADVSRGGVGRCRSALR